MEADETLISFNVTAIFTNVPTDEAVEVIHRKFTEEEDLVERTLERIAEVLQVCLKSTYFSYNGEFYEQREGRRRPCAPLSLQWLPTCTWSSLRSWP